MKWRATTRHSLEEQHGINVQMTKASEANNKQLALL
jgi:hypothetical protein